MSALLDMLNHVLREALAAAAPAGALQVRSVVLEEDGARVIAHITHEQVQGALVLRVVADPPQDGRQSLHFHLEQAPDAWGERLQPFRRLVERARLHLELDFTP